MTTAYIIPQPVNSIEIPKEQQSEQFLNEILSKKIKEIEKEGYNEVSYKFLEPLKYRKPVIDIHKTIEEKVLENYIFFAEYIKIEQGDNAYYFKSKQEVDNFLTQIKKYDKSNYTNNTIRKLVGSETSEEILNNIIAKKKTAYQKAEAERKRKEEAARKAAAAKKAQQEAAKKKTQTKTKTSVSSSYKATNVSGKAVVDYAMQFNGNPYVHGGTSLTKGADCSGFTQSVYKHFGINLPRQVASQATVGKYVSLKNIQPGDLVFYSTNGGKSVTHVAIYIGNNKVIHARTPKKGIGVSPVTGKSMVLMTIKRVL